MEMLTCPKVAPSFKFQFSNYGSRDRMSSMSSVMQDSSYSWIPGSDHGSPSTLNLILSKSSPDNSHKVERESSETENEDSQNAFWRFFKRGSSQTNEANQPGVTSNPVESIPENAQDCTTLLPDDTNSSQFSNSSESNLPASIEEKDSQNNNCLQDLVASSALHSCQRADQVEEPSSSADFSPKGMCD